MMPVFGYMDSHPFQKNQMPFSQYPYPGMETIPSHAMMDPAKSRMPYDTWPNGGHHGYPMPHYPRCNGANFPGYYGFRPPRFHVPSHQNMPCYGGYPPFSGPHYVQYVPPHTMEQPRYEFDKNMRGHHCCGCPNSLCAQNQKEDKGITIEEEEPGVQKKGSLIPIQFGNNQFPIVWIPSDSIESKKEKEPSKRATAEQEKEQHGSKSRDEFEKVPKYWSGCPLNAMQHENGKKQIPWPIIWVPDFGGQETVQNIDPATKPTELKLSPVNNESKRIEERTLPEDNAEVVKTMNQCNVPIEDMNHNKTEDAVKKKETRCIPVVNVDDNAQRESSATNVKTQSSSSPRKSKLPPVCLRVDPISKKKNGNGHSNSHGQSTKQNFQQDTKINDGTSIESKPVEANREKIIKPVEVEARGELDGDQGNKTMPANSPVKVSNEHCKEETGEENSRKEDTENGKPLGDMAIEKTAEEGSETCSVDLVGGKEKTEKTRLSDEEAAVLIQSAYRGYEIRKWELLKKLRQIAEVRQQVIEIQNHVKALEAAPQDEKQRVFIGETIMRLLLKLDTIQGLHPSVREFRKSLAKELVAVQERLDNIMTNRPSEPVQEIFTDSPADHYSLETQDKITEKEQNKDEVIQVGEFSSEETNDKKPLCGTDDMASSQCMEVNSGVTEVSEAEQLVELRETGFQNENIPELSSQMLSQQSSDNGKVPSSAGEETGDEAESGAKMEPNVEVVEAEHKEGEIFQTEPKAQTANEPTSYCEAVPLAEDPFEVHDSSLVSNSHLRGAREELTPIAQDEENGQTENLNAAVVEEHLMEEIYNDSNKIEKKKEESQGEENEHHLAINSDISENKSSNKIEDEGTSDESADLPLEQSNCGYGRNIQNENSVDEDNEERVDGICSKNDLGSEKAMDKKLVEENEKMREMVEKLMEAGKEQLDTISKLSGKVKELERKLAKKRLRRRCMGSSMSNRRTKAGKNLQYGLAA